MLLHLSQIRISDSKREKVCAVCPYLLLDLRLNKFQFELSVSAEFERLVIDCMAWSAVETKIYNKGSFSFYQNI